MWSESSSRCPMTYTNSACREAHDWLGSQWTLVRSSRSCGAAAGSCRTSDMNGSFNADVIFQGEATSKPLTGLGFSIPCRLAPISFYVFHICSEYRRLGASVHFEQ